MAGKVVWTRRAHNERIEILKYWTSKTKSSSYSNKLNLLIKEAVDLIKEYPEIGKKTDIKGVRIKIIRDYVLFYEFIEEDLYLLSFWDSRQDPAKSI